MMCRHLVSGTKSPTVKQISRCDVQSDRFIPSDSPLNPHFEILVESEFLKPVIFEKWILSDFFDFRKFWSRFGGISFFERIEWNVLLVNIFARRASSLAERRTLNYKWIVIKTT